MSEPEKNGRRLANWIDSFVEFSANKSSPEIWCKWTAIAIVGAALERRVWAFTRGSRLYPNLYTILVGKPGIGKSNLLSMTELMLRETKEPQLHVAPSSMTPASLVDSLALAKQTVYPKGGELVDYNSMMIVASELGVFLPEYNVVYMNMLQKLYDGEYYEERRRTSKVQYLKIERPQLSILGATTPSYLHGFLPDGAWDQGFTSRTIFVYAGDGVPVDLFAEANEQSQLAIDLRFDLRTLARLYGQVHWPPETKQAISTWAGAGGPPVPNHHKLVHYNTRRVAHLIKLCMVASASRGNELVIQIEDYNLALNWLLEMEAALPDIFSAAGGVTADARAIEDVWYFVFTTFAKEKKPIGEHRILSILKNKVPSHSIMKIIELMVRSQWIKVELVNGLVCYVPGNKPQ